MNKKLYISSYEYDDFAIPRRVLHYRKTTIQCTDCFRNCLVIETDNPLIGQKYGLQDHYVNTFYLINRVDEYAFDNLDEFPIFVYVTIVKTAECTNPVSLSELQNIAWACLYDNETDAYEHRVV